MPCQLLKSEWKNMGEDSAGFGRNGNVVIDGKIKFLERVTPRSLAGKRHLCRGTPYFSLQRVRVEMPAWRLYLSTTVPSASVISLHTYSPGVCDIQTVRELVERHLRNEIPTAVDFEFAGGCMTGWCCSWYWYAGGNGTPHAYKGISLSWRCKQLLLKRSYLSPRLHGGNYRRTKILTPALVRVNSVGRNSNWGQNHVTHISYGCDPSTSVFSRS
jgi:hypothetical protein